MIYFDNASTTKPSLGVIEKVTDILENNYANSSSLHSFGFKAEKEILNARKNIADLLKVNDKNIIFTSGGTEANNTAVFGAARAYKRYGNKIIVNKTEHPSVLEAYKILENEGFNVVYLDVDEKGYIDLSMLEGSIDSNTILISVMHVNNEIGTIQKIDEIGALIKRKNSSALFHVDAVQGFGKHLLSLKNIDLMTLSGHKIHAPKGIGALYIKDGVRINPLIIGGGQQNGFRTGTENTAFISALALASIDSFKNMNENLELVKCIKNKFTEFISSIDYAVINGDADNSSPYIINVSFEGIKGEVLLHSLEEKEIFIATGSACSSRQKNHKGTVDFINPKSASGAVRFSFSAYNTIAEAEYCFDVLNSLIPMLRKYRQR